MFAQSAGQKVPQQKPIKVGVVNKLKFSAGYLYISIKVVNCNCCLNCENNFDLFFFLDEDHNIATVLVIMAGEGIFVINRITLWKRKEKERMGEEKTVSRADFLQDFLLFGKI